MRGVYNGRCVEINMHEWELDINIGWDNGEGTTIFNSVRTDYKRYRCTVCNFVRLDYDTHSWFANNGLIFTKYNSCAQRIMQNILE